MATYLKPIVSDEYLFKREPEKKILLFITQGAHVSGTAMKVVAEARPEILETLKAHIASIKPTIGTVIDFSNSMNCIFIVSRKHYSSKHDLDLVSSALASLKDGTYKMSQDDFPTITALVAEKFPHIELKTAVWKDEFRLGMETIEWDPPVRNFISVEE